MIRRAWPGLLTPLFILGCSPATQSPASELPSPREAVVETAAEIEVEPECVAQAPLASPEWFHAAVGYEIFVRSFYDADGDGIGDLKGIIEKLDYLNDGDPATIQDLEVTLLWLMPISPSPSYHGYDVTDYRGVEPDYGTQEDLAALLQAAHQRGVRVILDLVMNHSSSQHPWFLEAQAPGSARRSWYVWSDEAREWKQPWGSANTWHKSGASWYYGLFSPGMPDLSYTNPEVAAEMNATALYWLAKGADGFRLDAVRYLVETGPGEGMQDQPETIGVWKSFAASIRAGHPAALLVGEAWTSNAVAALYHAGGEGLNMTFDFDLMESLIAGVLAAEPADIERVLCARGRQFPATAGIGNFLSNHDLLRVMSRLKNDAAAMRLGAALLFTLPGTPFVYYGEEIGMANGPTLDDKHKRTPMQWDATAAAGFSTGKPWLKVNSDYAKVNVAAQSGDPESLLSFYRTWSRLRQANPALRGGGFVPAAASSPTGGRLWAFVRVHQEQTVVAVANFAPAAALAVRVTPRATGAPEDARFAGQGVELWPEAGVAAETEGGMILAGDLGPLGFKMFSWGAPGP